MERGRAWALFRIVAGFALLLAGLIGWLLPVVPGWAFIIAGLALLGRHFHWARRCIRYARRARIRLTRRTRRRKLSRKTAVHPYA